MCHGLPSERKRPLPFLHPTQTNQGMKSKTESEKVKKVNIKDDAF